MWNNIKEECYAIIKCKSRELSVQLEERVRLFAYGMYVHNFLYLFFFFSFMVS